MTFVEKLKVIFLHLNDNPKQRKKYLKNIYNPLKADITPHQRVELSLNNNQPDRIPFDFWAVPEINKALKDYLNVKNQNELLDLLSVDCREVKASYHGPAPIQKNDGSYIDRWGSHRKKVTNRYGGNYYEYASFPLKNASSVSAVENWDGWPQKEYWDFSNIINRVKKINSKIEYYIKFELGGIFETAWGLYGFENFLLDLKRDPKIPNAIMSCVTDLLISLAEKLLNKAEEYIDIIYTFDDVGTQNNLLMSKQMWGKYILPHHQKLNKVIKNYDVKIMYHSCGAVYPLIKDFINKMNIDILNPLQPRAKGMDLQRIKDNYGERISFHGAIDIQKTLPCCTPYEIKREIKKSCEILGRDGGYICAPAHKIQVDTPLENIIAMYTTDRKVE